MAQQPRLNPKAPDPRNAGLRAVFQPRSNNSAGRLRGAQQNGFHQIAEALSGLNPLLTKYASKKVEEYNEDQAREGAAAFRKNKLKWAEAVKKGQVEEGANPHFIDAYKAEQHKSMARDFSVKLFNDYAEDPSIRTAEDPAQLDQWFTGKTSEFFGEDVLGNSSQKDIAEVLMPRLDALKNQLYQRHGAQLVSSAEAGYREELSTNSLAVLDNFNSTNLDPATAGAMLQEKADEASQVMRPTDVNRIMIDTAAARAAETGDYSFMSVVDHITTDKKSGSKLGNTAYARETKQKVLAQIERQELADERRAEKREKELVKQKTEALLSQGYGAAIQGDDDIDDVMTQLAQVAPAKVGPLYSFHKRITEDPEGATVKTNPETYKQARREIAADPTRADEIADYYSDELSTADWRGLIEFGEKKTNSLTKGSTVYQSTVKSFNSITGAIDDDLVRDPVSREAYIDDMKYELLLYDQELTEQGVAPSEHMRLMRVRMQEMVKDPYVMAQGNAVPTRPSPTATQQPQQQQAQSQPTTQGQPSAASPVPPQVYGKAFDDPSVFDQFQ